MENRAPCKIAMEKNLATSTRSENCLTTLKKLESPLEWIFDHIVYLQIICFMETFASYLNPS